MCRRTINVIPVIKDLKHTRVVRGAGFEYKTLVMVTSYDGATVGSPVLEREVVLGVPP